MEDESWKTVYLSTTHIVIDRLQLTVNSFLMDLVTNLVVDEQMYAAVVWPIQAGPSRLHGLMLGLASEHQQHSSSFLTLET